MNYLKSPNPDGPSDPFSLEAHFEFYLDKVQLKRRIDPRSPAYREIKRAFMGACSSILLTVSQDLPAKEEQIAVHILQNMIDQALEFWKNETS